MRRATGCATDDCVVYDHSLFPARFDYMAMQAYTENSEAYRPLFLDAKKYQAVIQTLSERLYQELHQKKA